MARELGAAAGRTLGGRWEQDQGERVEAQGDDYKKTDDKKTDGLKANGTACELKQLLLAQAGGDRRGRGPRIRTRRGSSRPTSCRRIVIARESTA